MLAREVRGGGLAEQAAREVDMRFEAAMAQSFLIVLPNRNDFDLCKRYLGQFDTGLRGGDAMHLAVAANHGAQMICTLDKKLLRAGKMLGLPVGSGIHGRT